jgi:DNA-binding MarR family transcriptional regulator
MEEIREIVHYNGKRGRPRRYARVGEWEMTPRAAELLELLHTEPAAREESNGQLAERLGLSARSVTRLLDELEERRLVRRAYDRLGREVMLVREVFYE